MEVDFTQHYIIVRHHCEAKGLILTEYGEEYRKSVSSLKSDGSASEHAQRVEKRFWDILSLRKEQGLALNLAGSASDDAQGDMNKVLGYFVTNKRVRFATIPTSVTCWLCFLSLGAKYLNITLALESHFVNYQYLYQEEDIDNAGPVWVSTWTLESSSVAITCTMAFEQGGDLQQEYRGH